MIFFIVNIVLVPVIVIRYLFVVALLLIVVIHLFCSLLDFINSLFDFCFIVRCSKEERFNFDPGLYSRYFDPVQVPVVHVQQLYLLNKNTIII